MIFHRNLEHNLKAWAEGIKFRPMVLYGARQVGKTHLIRSFVKKNNYRLVEVNFELNKELHNIFKLNLDPLRIRNELAIFFNINDWENTIIFFDEVQECADALTSLKYFSENLPSQRLIAAGSLLGVTLSPASFPVGKVEILNLYPMTFFEFIEAVAEEQILKSLHEIITNSFNIPFPETLHVKLWQLMLTYFIVGGMPAAVSEYIKNKDNLNSAFNAVRLKQKEIILGYSNDFAKHSGATNAMHLLRLFEAIPVYLGRFVDVSVRRFKFSGVIPKVSHYDRLSGAFDWLERANLIKKIPIVERIGIPLDTEKRENIFKVYMFDCGILGATLNLPPSDILKYDFGGYKGFLAENFVCQSLVANGYSNIYSWQGQTSEIEFIVQSKKFEGQPVPIEVKAGRTNKAKSLAAYIRKYNPQVAYIFGSTMPRTDNSTIRMPLYTCGMKEM